MNSKTRLKPLVATACAAALVGFTAFPAASTVQKAIAEGLSAQQLISEAQSATSASNTGVTKEETIHVQTSADGSVQKATATETLKNTDKLAVIADESTLADIAPSDSDTQWARADGIIAWSASGENVTYKGTVDLAQNTLPISANITYQLDGADVSAADLAGKSGSLRITYSFTNETQTPFAVVGMLELDDDQFSDIKVENGKTLAGTDSTQVIGIALPGLNSMLGITDLDAPSSFSITAQVKDCSIDTATLMVTSALFEDIDGVDLDMGDLSSLDSSMDELSSAVAQLASGAAQLASGSDAVTTGAEGVAGGASQLASGLDALAALPESVQALATANDTQLTELRATLDTLDLTEEQRAAIDAYVGEAGTLTATNAQLAALAQQLASGGIAQAIEAAHQLSSASSQLASGSAQVTSGATSLASGIGQFNSEGIGALTSALVGSDSPLKQLQQLPTKLDDLAAKASAYQSFGGKAADMQGSVSFIYQIDAIG